VAGAAADGAAVGRETAGAAEEADDWLTTGSFLAGVAGLLQEREQRARSNMGSVNLVGIRSGKGL